MGQRCCFGPPSPCSVTSLEKVKAEDMPAERSCGCQCSVMVTMIHIFVFVHTSKALTHLALPLNMAGVFLAGEASTSILCLSLLILWCQKM